ncbi:MAG: ribonuclease III [Saprospiraceae bacterium]|nr:ribonuclease III [Saprospiraceae bacterium]
MRNLLGFTPANLHLFKLAFFHKSNTSQQNGDQPPHNNERLEFLGDAVLGTVVAEYLFKKYPGSDEGFLTKMRSKIVKRKMLNDLGSDMGLDVLLNEFNQTRLSSSMMGNAFEALIGAVYLDGGYAATRRFVVKRVLRRYLDIHGLETFDDNFKSQLLEWCQKNGKEVEFKVISRFKHDKRDRFKVAVYVDNNRLSVAEDYNKKSAEQSASEKALLQLGILQEES